MNKKPSLLITLLVITTIFSTYALFSNIKSNVKLTDNSNYNKKEHSLMASKTNSNNTIQNGNLVKKNKNADEHKQSVSTNNKSNDTAKNLDNKIQKQNINIPNYLSKLPCITYELKQGETLTDIARRYENTCNLNTTVKMIKVINKIKNENQLDAKTLLSIPESTIKNGTLYKVISGDNWYKIANQYYSAYDTDSVMNLIVYVNNLPNNDLPLGELIFLPTI